jgi:hypothetical protein
VLLKEVLVLVSSQPTNGLGIRTYVYSTDRSINRLIITLIIFQSFDSNVESTSVHGVGSVWLLCYGT